MTPFSCIVADPPWLFGDALPGATRGAAKQYRCLSLDNICNFPLPPLADNSILFLWRVASMQEEALAVVRAWKFTPKSEIIWEKLTINGKPHFGMGRYVRASHETCIVATRGRFKVHNRSVRSRFSAPIGRHSEKPEAFYALVERLVGDVPRLEMFARRIRSGWTCLGDEISRMDPPVNP